MNVSLSDLLCPSCHFCQTFILLKKYRNTSSAGMSVILHTGVSLFDLRSYFAFSFSMFCNQISISAHLCVYCMFKSACTTHSVKNHSIFPCFSLSASVYICLPAALSGQIDISSDSHFVVPFLLVRTVCVKRESEEVLIMCLWKQIRFYIL